MPRKGWKKRSILETAKELTEDEQRKVFGGSGDVISAVTTFSNEDYDRRKVHAGFSIFKSKEGDPALKVVVGTKGKTKKVVVETMKGTTIVPKESMIGVSDAKEGDRYVEFKSEDGKSNLQLRINENGEPEKIGGTVGETFAVLGNLNEEGSPVAVSDQENNKSYFPTLKVNYHEENKNDNDGNKNIN